MKHIFDISGETFSTIYLINNRSTVTFTAALGCVNSGEVGLFKQQETFSPPLLV